MGGGPGNQASPGPVRSVSGLARSQACQSGSSPGQRQFDARNSVLRGSGLQTYFKRRDHGMATSQVAIVGHCACIVSRAAAAAIREPTTWRIPALVSAALLLSPWIGRNAAASGSAASVQDFANRLQHFSMTGDKPLSDRVTV